jgi:hypothetical protein
VRALRSCAIAFQRVLDFVDHTNVSSLGLLGLLALV